MKILIIGLFLTTTSYASNFSCSLRSMDTMKVVLHEDVVITKDVFSINSKTLDGKYRVLAIGSNESILAVKIQNLKSGITASAEANAYNDPKEGENVVKTLQVRLIQNKDNSNQYLLTCSILQ